MSDKHLSGLGAGGEPRKGQPKTEEERRATHLARYGEEKLPPRGTGLSKHLGDREIICADINSGEVLEGGSVADEQTALESPCHGYKLDGGRLVFSRGIKGALNKYEIEKYCKAGLDLKPPPPRLAARIKALREAGVHFRKKT